MKRSTETRLLPHSMARRLRYCLRYSLSPICLLALTLLPAAPSAAQEITELSAEEEREVMIAERFLQILRRSPKRGTALDRIYGHHVEFGTLDKLLQSLQDATNASPEDGVNWMLLGLFESQRGKEAEAIEAFLQAEKLRPDDAIPSFYLGQAYQQLGDPDRAIEALERAASRKPARADLLEIYRQLGRIHQRAQRTEEALDVWSRLEALFPDDPRVQEQIAITLVEEGQYEAALPRYVELAKMVRDEYRQTMFKIESAELEIKLGNRDKGIEAFEGLLENLNPEGWLFRDVRRRVEDVFLRSGDQDALVKYYEGWLEAHPEDVGAMTRLARFLAGAARIPEATEWMEKALKLAPTRSDLRRAFIDRLVDEQRYDEASRQYAKLVESQPGNPDHLREWGRLVLRNRSMEQEQREAEAARIWNRILTAQPDDAVTVAQVADLFRQSKMNDRALELYQRAVELAPAEPQYREYLGEYYHILKRPEDALKTWRAIAEGSRHNAVNVARLAEVLNSFGYLDDAVVQIAEACKLDPKDFSLQIRAAIYHNRAKKFEEALAYNAAAQQLASRDEEFETVIDQKIEVLQSSRELETVTDALEASLKESKSADDAQWHLLAKYQRAMRRWNGATAAINKALSLAPQSIPYLTTAASIAESSGDYGHAAEMNRQLASADRRSRSDHWMNVARLETQLGRTDEALAAGRELIIAAPGNTENYQFFAQLCFRLGKNQDGLDALRKAVRIDPTDVGLILALGGALNSQFKTNEAIEVYWRAFEKMEEVEDKVSVTMKLTNLYQQINQFDKLIARLERERQEEQKRREMTICLAQAHHTSGDYGTARAELESLLTVNTRDTNLLQQLSKLCEGSGDVDAAVAYQRQLADVAPGHETEYRLAQLLNAVGEYDESNELLTKLTAREEDPVRLHRSLDSLAKQGAYSSVVAITEPLLSKASDDWELMYREAVALFHLGRLEEAKLRFERILATSLAYDELSDAEEAKFKRSSARNKSQNVQGVSTRLVQRPTPIELASDSYAARRAAGLDENYNSSQNTTVWSPRAFGVARMASMAWLLRIHQDRRLEENEESTELPPTLESIANVDGDKHANALIDSLYLTRIQNDQQDAFAIARRLAKSGGRDAQQLFVNAANTRHIGQANSGSQPTKAPLNDEDLELLLECHEALGKNSDEGANIIGGTIAYASNGQAYIQTASGWVLLNSATSGLGGILEELKLAGREDQAEELLREQIERADDARSLIQVINLVWRQKQTDRMQPLFLKWKPLAMEALAKLDGKAKQSPGQLSSMVNIAQPWVGQLASQEETQEILAITGHLLDIAVEEGKLRADNPPRRRQVSTGGWSMQIYHGGSSSHAQVPYPSPNLYLNQSTLQVLRQTFESLQSNDVREDLGKLLRSRVEAATEENKPYELLLLGCFQWWASEQEEAIETFASAEVYLQNDPYFQLEMAMLHESTEDLERALEIIDGMAPKDQDLVKQKELYALRLAERLGDVDRARSAAERLFGLRLDQNTQVSLIPQMRRLGLNEMAEAVTARARRRSGNQTTSLATLMTLYQTQGKLETAEQVAHTILNRTKPAMSLSAAGGRNPARYRSGDDGTRTRALQLLKQTGGLEKMIATTEGQLERSPKSVRLYDLLLEYYQSSNRDQDAIDLLHNAAEVLPKSPTIQLKLADHYRQKNEQEKACDHYLALLALEPRWVIDDLYQIRQPFQSAMRLSDLLRAIEKIDLRRLGQPYRVADLISNMLRNRGEDSESQRELALNLFEKLYDTHPEYRQSLMSQLYDDELWKIDRIYKLGVRWVVPSKSDATRQTWFGIGNVRSYSSDGKVRGILHQMIQGVKDTPRAQDLRDTLQQAVQDFPDWQGGKFLLALIEREVSGNEAAEKLFKQLKLPDDLDSLDFATCWMIGQEFVEIPGMEDQGVELLEHAMRDSNQSSNELQYTPVRMLVKYYASHDQRDKARKIMLSKLERANFDRYDAQYASYQVLQSTSWVAGQLNELGFPVDAIRLYQRGLSNPQELANAASWGGSRFPETFRQGMNRAVEALSEVDPAAAVKEFLSVGEVDEDVVDAMDLMLSVPTIAGLTALETNTSSRNAPPTETSCQLLDLLNSLETGAVSDEMIAKRLKDLQSERPDDLSISVLRSLYALDNKREDAAEAIQALLALARKRPLDELAEGRRANSRQRREAAELLPLWLVAKACLAADQAEAGSQLGAIALEAADRQLDHTWATAILLEWSELALKQDNTELAKEKLELLLQRATRRPQRKKSKPEVNRTGMLPASIFPSLARGRSNGSMVATLALAAWLEGDGREVADAFVPPLTMSQFQIAMKVARLATENDMPTLARQSVRESLRGGAPVPDSPRASADIRSTGMMMVGPAVSSAEPVDAQTVGQALMKVIGPWRKKEGYPPAEVYELMAPLVFPANRPAQVTFMPQRATRYEVTSFAGDLIAWAVKADAAKDLQARILERDADGKNLSAIVMAVQLALAIGDQQEAASQFERLRVQVEDNGIASEDLTLAMHAVIPLLHEAPTGPARAAAFRLLERHVESGARQGVSPYSDLGEWLTQHLASQGDVERIEELYSTYLAQVQAQYARYSGNYSQYRQWTELANLSRAAARWGMVDLAARYAGQVMDINLSDYSRPSIKDTVTRLVYELRKQDAETRYQFWREWTMPQEKRRTFRIAQQFIQPSHHPAIREHGVLDDYIGNVTELCAAAVEAGKMEELLADIQYAEELKLPHAKYLRPLALVYAGQVKEAESIVKDLAASFPKRYGSKPNGPRNILLDYAIFRQCSAHEVMAKWYGGANRGRFTRAARRVGNRDVVRHIPVDFMKGRSLFLSKSSDHLASDFLHWFPASTSVPWRDNVEPWWSLTDGHVAHVTGQPTDLLYLNYPLAGDFDFSVDCYGGDWGQADIGFGGIIAELHRSNGPLNTWTVDGNESTSQTRPQRRTGDQYDRVTLRVRGDSLQVLINKTIAYEETMTGASPWLTLYCGGARNTLFRNPQLSGSVKVLDHVPLFGKDSMLGWNSKGTSGRQPKPRLLAQDSKDNPNLQRQQDAARQNLDWMVMDGVLHGEPRPQQPYRDQWEQQWLYYHRPLLDGESFSYEFLHDDGYAAHPTVGHTVLLIGDQGVGRHWVEGRKNLELRYGIPADANTIEQAVWTKKDLKLQSGEWSRVKLTRKGDQVLVEVNGVEADTIAIERDSTFGLFRLANEQTRVRNAVLKGDWPQELDDQIRDDLFAVATPLSTPDLNAATSIIGENLYAHDMWSICERAEQMADAEAYELLKGWVLPGATHYAIRTTYGHRPLEPNGQGGQLVSPAVQLVETARRLNKLDELDAAANQKKPGNPIAQNSADALNLLIALARSDVPTASGLLDALYQRQNELATTLGFRNLGAGYLAAHQAGQHPELLQKAYDLASKMRSKQFDKQTNERFRKTVATLEGQLAARLDPRGDGMASLTQWRPVAYRSPIHEFVGDRASSWRFTPGHVRHVPGSTWTQLYFQSPLRGNFEIQAQATTFGWKEVAIGYGMHAAIVGHTQKYVSVFEIMHGRTSDSRSLEIPHWDTQMTNVRIAVEDGEVTTYSEGVKIKQFEFEQQPDPWLVIQSDGSDFHGSITNLRILGNPEIPDSIDLIDMNNMSGWRADIYGESLAKTEDDGGNPIWRRSKDQIVGNKQQTRAVKFQESLLSYQRPMLEDGVIEFESFMADGCEVHPAVGRTAFLLREDGVYAHQMTNAQWNVDLQPDNAEKIEGSQPPKFESGQWNKIRLELRGDLLTLKVNETPIAEYEVPELPHQRHFGLFRYANLTRCKVRNLVYAGEWPKTLPALDAQQLSLPKTPFPANDGEKVLHLELSEAGLAKQQGAKLGQADDVQFTTEAATLRLRPGGEWPGIEYKPTISGDFDISVGISDLKFTPHETEWGNGTMLQVDLENDQNAVIELGVFSDKDNARYLKAMYRYQLPDGSNRQIDQKFMQDFQQGRLRLVRRGGEVYCLFQRKGESPQLIRSYTVGLSPVRRVFMQNKCGDKVGASELVLDDFQVRIPDGKNEN